MLFTQEYTLIPSLNEEQRSFLATLIFILETNLIIASVISILGFLTGGLLSIMVLFFNGLKIGEILNVSNGDIEIVISYLIGHGIFEIFAFILFSVIGLAGFRFYYHLYKGDDVRVYFPNISLFVFPTIVLLIAAFIEALSIYIK